MFSQLDGTLVSIALFGALQGGFCVFFSDVLTKGMNTHSKAPFSVIQASVFGLKYNTNSSV
ncbi:hypothetical protein [Dyadobacter fermentans]|uniref:hypothetical protein n=1 Tax=Dyadobacter fermentans TaxID=94254 RepID=UPI001CBC943E|nr:hypothetical protein [Dyadobacter fermentans]MBZ1362156.1 hypothetical protein [Dyadobacter fermentans]